MCLGACVRACVRACVCVVCCVVCGVWCVVCVVCVCVWAEEVQEEAALKGGKLFNAGGQHQACTDFMNAGEKPVYIGWGFMMVYSKEHMARLAVGALKEAGKRGIIVGGWAELSEESLGGDEHEELEGLQPQQRVVPQVCSARVALLANGVMACCVHHGGIGTTQASPRSFQTRKTSRRR